MSTKKPNLIVFIIPLVIFIGLVVVFSPFGESDQTQVSTVVNKPLPAFSLPDLADENIILTNANLPSEPYLVNFWGTWCIACSREHPLLMKIQEEKVNIVGINYKDEREYAIDYLATEGNPFLMNIYDEYGELGLELGLTGAPETFVVDASGIIRQHLVGEITADNWQAHILPCLTAVKENKTEDELSQVCQ